MSPNVRMADMHRQTIGTSHLIPVMVLTIATVSANSGEEEEVDRAKASTTAQNERRCPSKLRFSAFPHKSGEDEEEEEEGCGEVVDSLLILALTSQPMAHDLL